MKPICPGQTEVEWKFACRQPGLRAHVLNHYEVLLPYVTLYQSPELSEPTFPNQQSDDDNAYLTDVW